MIEYTQQRLLYDTIEIWTSAKSPQEAEIRRAYLLGAVEGMTGTAESSNRHDIVRYSILLIEQRIVAEENLWRKFQDLLERGVHVVLDAPPSPEHSDSSSSEAASNATTCTYLESSEIKTSSSNETKKRRC